MFLPVHHSYIFKPVIFITYQHLCEWVCVFFLGTNIVDFYHIIYHIIYLTRQYLNKTLFIFMYLDANQNN